MLENLLVPVITLIAAFCGHVLYCCDRCEKRICWKHVHKKELISVGWRRTLSIAILLLLLGERLYSSAGSPLALAPVVIGLVVGLFYHNIKIRVCGQPE